MSAEPSFRLVWQRVGTAAVEFPLTGDVHQVGRDAEVSDLVVDEPLVSRRHARLERREGRWYVVDLASTNATRVNGGVVTEWPLNPGDELRFARARCLFLGPEGMPAEPEQRAEPQVDTAPEA
jgi:pSer/pThr/pTyr-binding forkhead associated (FHA) protein